MLFNSFEFLIFFPVVTALYFLLPHSYRWALLLLASCVFYMFFIPSYILILFVTIIIDYFAGKWIEDSTGKKRKHFLWFSIISTCMVLFVFKYFNFFISNFNEVASLIGWNYSINALSIILPIGLSFHTFQSLSYVIEVYRGNQKAERHFGIYSLYVMFYPQLVAGPIERPQNILHQFYEKHTVQYENFSRGLQLMVWGLFKKVVIADNLAGIVSSIYAQPEGVSWYWLLLGSYFFAVQIYCDFSGYSDMAIGAARVMGFRLMENFNTPYFSKSIQEFWSRWHISLSSWFRDYVYIPLGGNRGGNLAKNRNQLIVFAISGLWHGANWTYVVWGILHGFYLVIEGLLKKTQWYISYLQSKKWIVNLIGMLIIFNLVTFGWIFFRANSIDDAFKIIKGIFTLQSGKVAYPGELGRFNAVGMAIKIAIAVAFLFVDPLIHKITRTKDIPYLNSFLRMCLYAILAATIILLGFWGDVEFIYFQF